MWKDIVQNEEELRAFAKAFEHYSKFYTDENIEPVIVEILRDLKFDILTAKEAGLIHRDDTDHFAFAYAKNRILITYDQDFLDDREFPPHRCSGVVVLDTPPLTSDKLTNSLYILKTVIAPYRDLWKGVKVIIHNNSELTVFMNEHGSGKRTKTRYRIEGRKPQEWM